jgi:hypothetical protein
MSPLLISAGYVGLHFTTYALAGRHHPVLQTERGIFAWHAISYLLALLLAACTVLLQSPAEALILGGLLAGLHGIYSLSFLEIWSLTQGSYSLQLLSRIEQCGPMTADEVPGAAGIGSQKQQDRAGALCRLGLARMDGRLTPAGWIAAQGLRAILWLSHGKPLN